MAFDLAYYDRGITSSTQVIVEMKAVIAGYNTNIQKCKDGKEGLFSVYSCKRNTGKTIDDWRDARKLAEIALQNAKEKLALLTKERASAQISIDARLNLRGSEAEVELQEAIASGEAAKKYGLWIGVIGIVLVFGYLAFKKIRS